MEENLSSPEDLESDFVDETSEDGECDGEAPGMVPSRLSFTRSCSQYSSSELEDGSSTAHRTKVRRRRKRRKRVRSGMVRSGKEEVIEAAVRAGDKDRLSQLAVSEGGLLSDEVSVTSLSVEM